MTIFIDGRRVTVAEGTRVLDALRANAVEVPTLCYLKELGEIGACRLCLVEVKGCERLVSACQSRVWEGMEIFTHSERVRAARRRNLRLILSRHDAQCLTCERNGKCQLQTLAQRFGLEGPSPHSTRPLRIKADHTLPVVRNDARCVHCLRCVGVCARMQGANVWDLLGVGSHARVGVRGARTLAEAGCTFCGQCVLACPVSALNERDDSARFLDAVREKRKIVVSLSPALKRFIAAFHRLGIMVLNADHVRASAVRAQLAQAGVVLSTRCPAVVRLVKHEFPDLTSYLSTVPALPRPIGIDSDVFCVAVDPCLAGKDSGGVDLVLTDREIERVFSQLGIETQSLPNEPFDGEETTDEEVARCISQVYGPKEVRQFLLDLRAGRVNRESVELWVCSHCVRSYDILS